MENAKLKAFGLQNSSKFVIVAVILIAIALTIIIIFSSCPTKQSPPSEDSHEEKIEFDERISPLVNQGLMLEVKRIRNRGLLDELMHFGINWRKTPQFKVEIEIDQMRYFEETNYDLSFDTWDTWFQEFRVIRDAEEGQETSTIKIIVLGKNQKLPLLSKYEKKEQIDLIYDYKTGRWDGDDKVFDEDGYGHFLGEEFEIWFNIYQNDYDGDGIPYWTEVNILGTDPKVDDSELDPDGDKIPTTWEWKWGYDPFIWDDHENLDPDIDGLSNIEEYKMQKWLADPFSRDIYIEADGMQKGWILDWEHTLFKETTQIITERFAENGINVYIDDGWPNGPIHGGGELVPYMKVINYDSGEILRYYKNYFPDERKGIFRYLLVCRSAGVGFSGSSEFNRFDTMAVGTNPFETYLLRSAFTPRTQRLMLASAILHELGHLLGIAPYTIEGCDNISFIGNWQKYQSEWGNYRSVMNYLYIFDKNLVDYSDGSHGKNDQNDWEQFYLPFFKIENEIIVEPGVVPPASEKVVKKNVSIDRPGWEYNESLTNLFEKMLNEFPTIYSGACEFKVFIRISNASYNSNRNILVYARPLVWFSDWSLIKEGYIEDGIPYFC
jgi:hypothetical protein